MFLFDPDGRLFRDAHVFDPATRRWHPAQPPAGAQPLSAEAALLWLQQRGGHPERAPVAVIGPNEAPADVLAAAEAAGALLGRTGLVLLCGGRQGVMEAACRGSHHAGGLSIALLPGADPATANPYAAIVMATGIGEARNALIAQSAACLIAVGNSHGTLSEVALGLRLGKSVFGLAGAAEVDGVRQLADVSELAAALAEQLLGVDFG